MLSMDTLCWLVYCKRFGCFANILNTVVVSGYLFVNIIYWFCVQRIKYVTCLELRHPSQLWILVLKVLLCF